MSAALRITRILVGIDFTEPSAAAVRMAGVIAAAYDAALTVVHAERIDMPPYFTEAQVEALEAGRRDARGRALAEARAFASAHADVPIDVVIEEGAAADVLLRLAPAFDLIVLGTDRLRGPRRWWLGSVAESVVRHAPVPVLVVPALPAEKRLP